MKLYRKLDRFPLGAIRAEGFLRQQMERGKEGMAGHLYELEPGMIRDPYLHKTYVPAWADGEQSGWGAEISGNYWTGYIEFAFTLGDAEMIRIATDWVDAMLKNQREDGYLGTYYEEDAKIYEDFNGWGTACAMRGLLAFYEATGRADVLEAVRRCMLWFVRTWAGDRKTPYSGHFLIEPMVFTYVHTGDRRLAAFAEEYLAYECEHDLFESSWRAMREGRCHYNGNHTAGMGLAMRLPALVYAVTGKREYLEASERRIADIRAKAVHLSGSPVSVAEYLGPVGATTETEYCNYAYYNASYSYMSCITGEAKYGDYMEQMFYNGAQGARKKDEKAIAYLNAPNQIYATTGSSSAVGNMQVYAPCYPVACCPVNSVAVVPEFVRGMLLRDGAGNLYAAAYGPCSLHYGDLSIREETDYPFRNRVVFEFDCAGEFALCLKIPDWCRGYTVRVNGEVQRVRKSKTGYAALRRRWKPGDRAEIVFRAAVEVVRVDDSDFAAKYPLAIRYGALLFAYHIPEHWEPIAGSPATPLPKGWSWYNVTPAYEEPDEPDFYIRLGLRRYRFPWNIALDEDLRPEEIEIEELPADGYVWEHPMIRLHTHAYKAPWLNAVYPERSFEPFGAYQTVTERVPLTLEPYGCTNLRITYFPKAKPGTGQAETRRAQKKKTER